VNKLYAVFIVLSLSAFVVGCGSFVKPESEQKTTEQIKKSVVKIRAENQMNGEKREGTGFVVGVSDDKAYIVTVSHVVEGDPNPTVEFFENNKFKAEVLDNEAQENGLALLSVKGLIPYDVMPLYLVRKQNLNVGDTVFTVGFPSGGARWSYDQLSYSGQKRRNFLFSGSINDGNSGSPIIKEDIVVAVITSMTKHAYAISAESVREFLGGVTGGRQVIDNMEKWTPSKWRRTQKARLENAKFVINEQARLKEIELKIAAAKVRLREAEAKVAMAEQARLQAEAEVKRVKVDAKIEAKLDAAKQNRKQAEIEVAQAKADIEKAEQHRTAMLSKTKLGKFMLKLDHGEYVVVAGSYDKRKDAQDAVKNILAKYPELFYPQINSLISETYQEDGIYWSVNEYWVVYIGGLYTADSARKLRNYAIKKLHGFRKDIYVINIYAN
jgi:hypothetical protein